MPMASLHAAELRVSNLFFIPLTAKDHYGSHVPRTVSTHTMWAWHGCFDSKKVV
jgi:hypothetical protein